jgi:hypothetical protein
MTENGEARRVQQGGFVTIVGADRARSFYRDANRPEPLKGEPHFALVFHANSTMLRLGIAIERQSIPGTVPG